MSAMLWDREAEKALDRVPFFVRGMVRRKVEERVRKNGGGNVGIADFREAEERFSAVAKGKSSSELQTMLPQENKPGAEMVLIEVCQNELTNCPNVLIKTSEWKNAVEKWIKESDLSERLRKRVEDDKILYHHKFRVSISGCPNACSRPQIADVGLVGYVRPFVDAATCAVCGECVEACPDGAIVVDGRPPVFDFNKCLGCLKCGGVCPNGSITVTEPGVRVLAGGKLGRHPMFAEVVGEFDNAGDVIALLSRMVDEYIDQAKPGERFADFRARLKGVDSQ